MPELHVITAWVMAVALLAYVILGGADFGGGVLSLLARGPHRRASRELIDKAIGPVWEANHVWLIVVIVLMFAGFPPAFASVTTALHVPLTLMLLGIVFRGSAFIFKVYGHEGDAGMRWWPPVFHAASVLTPVLLGVSAGAVASGALRWDNGVYVSGFFAPWLRLFPFSVGLLALALFVYLAAVYLCVEAQEPRVREGFRRSALVAGAVVAGAAALSWAMATRGAPAFSDALAQRWWSWPLVGLASALAVGAFACVWTHRFVPARALAVAQVSCIVLGFAAALFPYLIVPQVTVQGAAAPAQVHALLLGALAAGSVILIPSLWWLMRVFKGPEAFAVLHDGPGGRTGRRETAPDAEGR